MSSRLLRIAIAFCRSHVRNPGISATVSNHGGGDGHTIQE